MKLRTECLLPALLFPALLWVACGGSQNDDTIVFEGPQRTIVETEIREDGRYVQYKDIDLDGRVDTILVFMILNDDGIPVDDRLTVERMSLANRRQVEKEMDVNGDGDMDVRRMYANSGELEREERDVNFDGQFDRVALYDNGYVSRVDADMDGDGAAETVRFYRGGGLFRVEFDESGSGTADHYYYYDELGLAREGVDPNEDGVIDDWVRRPMAEALSPAGEEEAIDVSTSSNDAASREDEAPRTE
jgi:hypothetical protein